MEGEIRHFYKGKAVKAFCPPSSSLYFMWNNKELCGICFLLARKLRANDGVLADGSKPYTWCDVARDFEISNAAVYKWREKLVRGGFVRELHFDGKKWIALNPQMFGHGASVPLFIKDAFDKPYEEIKRYAETDKRIKKFRDYLKEKNNG